MSSPLRCSLCGGPLPSSARGGACWRCLGEGLLAAEPEAPTPPGPAEAQSGPELVAGQSIGHYRLLEKIGEGGCGVVYVAEQTEPVRRRVAVKVIKLGMDTKAVVARFEAERQALAMMDHPNIAQVFDGGTTETGRPYFVMELVRGVALTHYCDEAALSTRERLELFIKVCQAVQHAHQKGIIHRDLKPSNILVTLHDGVPVPKVIDFGIAKAIEGRLGKHTVYTQLHQFIGTPAYMSPEQAELTGLDIDTRSDIYSLGVLLYELLAGSPPFDPKELLAAGLDAMRKIIREQEPLRPSTRLSTLAGSDSTTTAKRRSTDPARLRHQLQGDLDWIVMRCLEKDRRQRYETANGLAADLKRHLSDEPVTAGPPSMRYRLWKFTRRNRGKMLAGGVVAAVFLLGLVGTTWGFIQARQRLAQTRQAAEIMGAIFENLDPEAIAIAPSPLQASLAKELDRAVRQLEGSLGGDPLYVARMQEKFGWSLLSLKEEKKAIGLLERALATLRGRLGDSHPDTLDAMHRLARAYDRVGRPDRAVPLSEEALKRSRTRFGHDDPETVAAMGILAECYLTAGKVDLALPLAQEALGLARSKSGSNSPMTFSCLGSLAMAYQRAGPSLALPFAEEALKLARSLFDPYDSRTLSAMSGLAKSYQLAGKLDLALPLSEELLKLERVKFGPDDVFTLIAMNNLASGYLEAGKPGLALPLAEEALKRMRSQLGSEHPRTREAMQTLADAYKASRKLDLALPLYEEAVRIGRTRPYDEIMLGALGNLGAGYFDAGKLDLALPVWEEVLRLDRTNLGPNHVHTTTAMVQVAVGYRAAGKLDLAVPLFEEALKEMRNRLGSDHPSTRATMGRLAEAYEGTGKLDLAVPLYEEAVKLGRSGPGPCDETTLINMDHLAGAYWDAGKRDLALPLWEETVTLMRTNLGPTHPHTTQVMARLAGGYRTAGKLDRAVALYEEAVKIGRGRPQPCDEQTLRAMWDLAGIYWGAGKGNLALPLMEETVKLMRTNLGPDHPVTTIARRDLAGVYRMTAKLDLSASLFEEALRAAKAKQGPDHPDTLAAMCELALAYQLTGRLDLAVPLFEEGLKRMKLKLDPDGKVTLLTMSRLARAYTDTGKHDLAWPLLEETLKLQEEGQTLRRQVLGPEYQETVGAFNQLAWFLATSGDSRARDGNKAVRLAEGAVAATSRNNPGYLDTLAAAYAEAQQYDKAAATEQEAIALYQTEPQKKGASSRLSLYRAGQPYHEERKP